MKRFIHHVWRVEVGSRNDGPVGCIQDLPVRADYRIESRFKNGGRTLERKAFEMAAEDGIENPIIMGMYRLTSIASGEK